MDALGVMDMCVERTWKVSSAEVQLRGMLPDIHRGSQGEQRPWSPKIFSIYSIVILHFERRYPKQNSVIHLKANILR